MQKQEDKTPSLLAYHIPCNFRLTTNNQHAQTLSLYKNMSCLFHRQGSIIAAVHVKAMSCGS